jgi:2-methylcitrate dehydratase PrpD
MGLTQDLVGHIVGTGFGSLDGACVERAKWRVLDVCGCALAGMTAPGCDMMLDMVTAWAGAPESTILGHGGRVPAHNAAMLNSLMARSYDHEPVEAEFDDRSGPAHISGTTVSVALAMAEKQGAGGRDLLTALAVGDDIAARLAANSGFDFDLGWDNTGTVNVFGATAIACKLLGLGGRRVFNALGIALNRLSGTMAGVFDKTLAFKLPIAFAAKEGIVAAELAERGFAGVDEPLLGPRGYFALYCRDYDAGQVTKDLGTRFYSDCVIKPYSACRMTHAFIDCALAIVRENAIHAGDVAEIVIHATERVAGSFVGQPLPAGTRPLDNDAAPPGHDRRAGEKDAKSANSSAICATEDALSCRPACAEGRGFVVQRPRAGLQQPDGAFSVWYCVAAALLWGAVGPRQFTEAALNDSRVADLIRRTRLVADMRPVTPGDKQAEVRVVLNDGTTLAAGAATASGDLRTGQVSAEQIREKFLANAASAESISREDAERAMGMVERLEELEDVGELTRLLGKGGDRA